MGWGDFGKVEEVFSGGESIGGREDIVEKCRVGVVCIVFWLRGVILIEYFMVYRDFL